jgi:hypothetical protein
MQIETTRMPVAWSPLPYTSNSAPLIPRRPGMGDSADASGNSKAFIDSAMVSFITDLAAAVPAGILAYTYGKAKSGWSNFFWVIAGLAGFKAMIDLSRIRQK